MPLHVRFDGDIAVLSNVGRSMNDPRYVDAGREVAGLLDEGYRAFVIELRDVGEVGAPLLGLLVTLTRQVRRHGGEVALAGPGRGLERFLSEMRMEEFWDVYGGVESAKEGLSRRGGPAGP